MPGNIPKRLFTVQETACYLGRTACAVRELAWSGKIPVVRLDRRIFFDVRDLDRLIEESKVREAF